MYTSIITTNLCELQSRKLNKLPENAKICWLTAKFGLPSISKLCIALKSVPQSLTGSQRVQAIAEFSGLYLRKMLLNLKSSLLVSVL